MTANQRNRKNMHDVVLEFLDSNVAKYASIPAVGRVKNHLAQVNRAIEESHNAQIMARVYLGKNKKQLKKQIAEKADILNDVLELHAEEINDPALAERMNASESDLFRENNPIFATRVKDVIDHSLSHVAAIKLEYGVTDEQIDDLMMDLDRFENISGLPRSYKIKSKVATSSLDDLFKEANQVLERLDKVMKIFKRRDPHFHNTYLAARVVVG